MYIENSISNSINTDSITLNRLMLNSNTLLEQKNCKRILIIPNYHCTLLINNSKFYISNQICFVDGNDQCELRIGEKPLKIFLFEFTINSEILSLNRYSFIKIDEEISIYYSYIKSLYLKKILNTKVLNHILTYFLMLNDSLYLSDTMIQHCPNIVFEIKEYLEKNIDSKIKIQDIANNFFISRSELFYIFKKYTNTTIIEYLNTIRINKAKELLKNTDYTITEISQLVGYDSLQYFSRIFRKNIGSSPSEFRKLLAKRLTTFYIEKGGDTYENFKKYSTI